MTSNIQLSTGYFGESEVNGTPAYAGNAGLVTVGCRLSSWNTQPARFGAVVCAPLSSSATEAPGPVFVDGEVSVGSIVGSREYMPFGFIKANQGVMENFPVTADVAALNGSQITVMTRGVAKWYDITINNPRDKVGKTQLQVMFNKTTGEIGLGDIEQSDGKPSGWDWLVAVKDSNIPVAKCISVEGNCYTIQFDFMGIRALV